MSVSFAFVLAFMVRVRPGYKRSKSNFEEPLLHSSIAYGAMHNRELFVFAIKSVSNQKQKSRTPRTCIMPCKWGACPHLQDTEALSQDADAKRLGSFGFGIILAVLEAVFVWRGYSPIRGGELGRDVILGSWSGFVMPVAILSSDSLFWRPRDRIEQARHLEGAEGLPALGGRTTTPPVNHKRKTSNLTATAK